MKKSILSFAQFNEEFGSCILSAVTRFAEQKTGEPVDEGWSALEMKALLSDLEIHARRLARRIYAMGFESLEILVPDASDDHQPIKFVSHPAWLWKFDTADGVHQSGFMIGKDLRDAVSRVLVSEQDDGKLFGEAYRIPIDVLDEAPGNRQAKLVIERPGMCLQFHSL